MGMDWVRDLVIVISGSLLVVALIIIIVLLFLMYCRVRSILDSIKKTTRNVQEVSTYVGDEVVKPITQVVALIQGIRQGVDSVSKIFRKKERRRKK